MKSTDDRDAKIKLWVQENRVIRMPKAEGFPAFGCRRFSSADEMNVWKKELLDEIARRGGARWTS